MPHHAITLADGSVAIMQTVGDADPGACIGKWPLETQALVIARTAIDPGVIPADRTFRNAWTLSAGLIGPDMGKARDIWRGRLREQRAPLLAALDEAYLRADETKDDAAKAKVAAAKQALRDAPADPAIVAAATPQDLKAVTLAVLAPNAVTAAAAAGVDVAADADAPANPAAGANPGSAEPVDPAPSA